MIHWESATWAPSDHIDENGFARPAPHGQLRGHEVHISPSDLVTRNGAWGWCGSVDPGDGRESVRRVIVHVASAE